MSEGRVATIDADGHVIEPADLWERELPSSLRARGFHIRWDAETEQEQVWVEERLLLPVGIVGVGMAGRPFEDVGKGVRYAELMPGGTDARRRLRDLDAEGIDVAVLYPSVGLFLEAIEDAALAEACCRVYNDWLADYCRTDPRRLVGIAGLPLQDVGAAVREMRRAVGQLGMRGVFVRPNPDARSPTCEPRTGTGRSPSTCAAPSCVRNTPYRTSFGGAAG